MTMLQLSCKILIVITNDNDETFLREEAPLHIRGQFDTDTDTARVAKSHKLLGLGTKAGVGVICLTPLCFCIYIFACGRVKSPKAAAIRHENYGDIRLRNVRYSVGIV